jgi:hypothetical protein
VDTATGAKAENNLLWFVAAFVVVVVSAAFAGSYTGAYWRSAGLLIGPAYWGAYLAALAAMLLVGRRWLAIGMLAALPIALLAFFGLAIVDSFPSTP